MSFLSRAFIVSAMLLCMRPVPLCAQTADSGGQGGTAPPATEGGDESSVTRPFRGLFGLGDSGRTGASLSGALFGAYENNLAATLPGRPFDPRYQRSGWYTGANTQLSMNWRGERASLSGFGYAGTSYYPDFDKPFVPSYSAGIGFGRAFGQRNNFHASQAIQYSPYFLNGFFADLPQIDETPVVPVIPDPGYDVSGETILRSSSSVSVARRLSRSATFSASYGYSRSDYSDMDRVYEQQKGSITFVRRLTQHASLRLGYGHRRVTHDFGVAGLSPGSRSAQDIDLGIDYNRAFAVTMTRRTRVSFTTGTSYFSRSDIAEGERTRRGSRIYVTGTAQLLHEMGRSWRAALAYRRSAGFNELVFDPVVSDSVTASLSGLLGRRSEFSAYATTAVGHVVNGLNDNGYTTYAASAQFRRAITRHLAAYVSYLLYNHDFENQVLLPGRFPRSLDRQGVNFGVNVWIPLR